MICKSDSDLIMIRNAVFPIMFIRVALIMQIKQPTE